MKDKVRYSILMTEEQRRMWKSFVEEIGARNSAEAMMLMIELYRVCSKHHKTKDVRELISYLKSPFGIITMP